jgi:SAM-dependent methyltransferase
MEHPWPPEGLTGLLFGNAAERARALAIEPGLHNVLGVEAAFARDPSAIDFLDPTSPNFALKALSTCLYRRFLDPILAQAAPDARALDVGCGIGRFTTLLAKRFADVAALDASPSSLHACARRLRRTGAGPVELHWADLSLLDEWPDRFDVVIAAEVVCYAADPASAMRRIARAARPGAWILASVEARPGAPAVEGPGGPEALLDALEGRALVREGDRHVTYFDRAGFETLLADAGLRDVRVEGSHYLGEGPFWSSIDDERLGDPEYVRAVLDAEERCARHPLAASWARAWIGVGRKA